MGRLTNVERLNRSYERYKSIPHWNVLDFKRKMESMYIGFMYYIPNPKDKEKINRYLLGIKGIRYRISMCPVMIGYNVYIEKI